MPTLSATGSQACPWHRQLAHILVALRRDTSMLGALQICIPPMHGRPCISLSDCCLSRSNQLVCKRAPPHVLPARATARSHSLIKIKPECQIAHDTRCCSALHHRLDFFGPRDCQLTKRKSAPAVHHRLELPHRSVASPATGLCQHGRAGVPGHQCSLHLQRHLRGAPQAGGWHLRPSFMTAPYTALALS